MIKRMVKGTASHPRERAPKDGTATVSIVIRDHQTIPAAESAWTQNRIPGESPARSSQKETIASTKAVPVIKKIVQNQNQFRYSRGCQAEGGLPHSTPEA